MIKSNPSCIRVRLFLCLFMACVCLHLHAQELGDTIVGKVHSIPEVNVKGRRVSPSLTSAAPLQQMKKIEMERLGVLDVADAVRHFSGVSVKDYGGIGGLKTVSVRRRIRRAP